MTTFFSRRGGTGGCKPTTSIRVGHVYLDAHRHTLYCLNNAARQLIDDGVSVTGDHLDEKTLRHLDGTPVRAADLPLLRAWRDRTPQEAAFLFTGNDGLIRHLTCSATPLVVADQKLQGVMGCLVVAPLEPDWQYLAGLAHDLRTPLQALRLLTPLLESDTLPQGERQDMLQRLRAAGERALSIGRDLVEWARGPMLGGRRIQRNWFALEPFLGALSAEHVLMAQRKAITWRTEFRGAEGVEVYTDPVRLGRLLSNLLTNAIRYTAQGEIRFVAGWRSDPLGQREALALGIIDTGSGISEEEQESIFNAFERGRSGKTGDSSGSGVGLAVVDRLIEELGLTLEVFSEAGHGSKFEVIFPSSVLRPVSSALSAPAGDPTSGAAR
jgi:signal transduction histidine kinase